MSVDEKTTQCLVCRHEPAEHASSKLPIGHNCRNRIHNYQTGTIQRLNGELVSALIKIRRIYAARYGLAKLQADPRMPVPPS